MVEEVTPEELHEALESGENVQVIDIRSAEGFEQGHVPGAINLPFEELPRRIDEIEWGEFVVAVCPKGISSRQAARLIESYEGVDADARVANLDGGYEAWDYDLETGTG